MGKRDDEEFAKEAFSRFLARSGITGSVWQDGPDPPDFTLSFEASEFAVEVTQVMEQFDLGERPLSYRGIAKALKGLTQRIQAQATAAGVLKGTWVLALSPIPNLAEQEATLVERTLRFLANPAEPNWKHWTPLLDGPDGPLVEIVKLLDTGATIGEMLGGSGPKWGGQIVQEASRLIQGALSTKADRLKAIPGAHILLLIDEYHYAPPEIWHALVAGAPVLHSHFHTIARVHAEYECQILHSKEPSWNAAV
jgi:hypothetical protein